MSDLLGQPLTLRSGATLKNRIAKSAMSERLGRPDQGPSDELVRLYSRWAQGGAGLLITGNVMIDRGALGEFGNVAIEDERHLEALSAWAEAGKQNGTQIWMQINHPGRQMPRQVGGQPVAPSPIAVAMPGFAKPRELTDAEIKDLVEAFARTAKIAQKAGFSGVQIHGAHGYLISQFLSPRTNLRTDDWGGTPEKRRRFVIEIVAAIRAAVGPDFPVGLKLNSADFQRGGFSEEESMEVVLAVEAAGVDLLEISGGTYERSTMVTGEIGKAKASTQAREAYFLEYAEAVRKKTSLPLLLTGGFRSKAGMEAALQSGAVDCVGIARPMVIEPDLPGALISGERAVAKPVPTPKMYGKFNPGIALMWFGWQLQRMGEGHDPKPKASFLYAIWLYMRHQSRMRSALKRLK